MRDLAVSRDQRGSFMESWRASATEAEGLPAVWVQDNVAVSTRGVLRGLHFQNPRPQGKLIVVSWGEVYDVVVDLRRGSATFGEWEAFRLSSEKPRQLYVPAGFAHGYQALSDQVVFLYKCTAYYEASGSRVLRWNDPDLGIPWPIPEPILSDQDRYAPLLRDLASAS